MSAPARPRRPRALASLAILLVAAFAVAGCGGDDEGATDTTTSTPATPPTRTVTVPVETAPESTDQAPAPPKGGAKQKPASPEDQPGGAGDEEPVRSEVVLTGRGGKIGPLLVKVPPFVSIRVALRSADGKPYVVKFGSRVVRAGVKGARSSATFDGLRPGRRLLGVGVAGRVVIEASAEPGP